MCDWKKAESEYVTSQKGLREIAKEFGAAPSTVYFHSKNEGWVEKRAKYQSSVVAKTVQKAVEKISEDQSELAASLNRSALQFAQRVHDRLIDPGEIKPMDLLRLAQVWQILHDSITKDKDVDEEQVGGIVMMVDRTEEDEN